MRARGRPANDAQLVQAVRTALGRGPRLHEGPRINISSCSFVVSLHGTVPDGSSREAIAYAVASVPGVAGVKNELRLA